MIFTTRSAVTRDQYTSADDCLCVEVGCKVQEEEGQYLVQSPVSEQPPERQAARSPRPLPSLAPSRVHPS
jgi:hypothetical protein